MALCTVQNEGGIALVVMPLQIDHVTSTGLEAELKEIMAKVPKAILCDFSQTKYISSSGLRVILLIAKLNKETGGTFGLYSLSPFVAHIFGISGFSKIMPIYESKDAAVKAVSGK
ncbi:MAG: STAS domain protein [Methanoregula sp. PtaU1.Bin051]|nr:MAG: STAS domain protein [Methanoregula sp. PtaU1.Bin051]